MLLNYSCPAVSHIYSLNTCCSSFTSSVPNSTPTVTSWSVMNSLLVNLWRRQDLPTAVSPIIISLKRKSWYYTLLFSNISYCIPESCCINCWGDSWSSPEISWDILINYNYGTKCILYLFHILPFICLCQYLLTLSGCPPRGVGASWGLLVLPDGQTPPPPSGASHPPSYSHGIAGNN